MFRRHIFIATLFVAVLLLPGAAFALCAAPPLEPGSYVNPDQSTRSMTRMTLRFRCGDVVLNGTRVPSYFEVRLWGSCTPQDCDWGTSRAARTGGSGPYVATYDQGFAQRRVEIHPLGSERARVVVHSSYSDDRADRTTTDTMRQEQVSWEPDTNRPGSDYRNYRMDRDQPGRCAESCEGDPRCRAFTYVTPGVQGATARCWLKDSVPQAVSRSCCVSGHK